jgi:ABC-2 type transport system permease protein/lipopolysaccharide transport system permease protein
MGAWQDGFMKEDCIMDNGSLIESIKMYRLWIALGSKDIKLKYRGSVIGPFWLVLNLGLLVSFLTVIYSVVFGISVKSYVPYVTLGFATWYLISSTIIESSKSLIENSALIRNFDFPVPVYVLRVLSKNLYLFIHNLIVFIFVVFIFDVKITLNILYLIPGISIDVVILTSLGILAGIISARFRDVPHIIESIMQMSMFLTPILFYRDMVKNRSFIVDSNPFYHMVDVLRAPLLGTPPDQLSWYYLLFFAVLLISITHYVLKNQAFKVPYWV